MEKRKAMDFEQKTLTSELTRGKWLAQQLMNHLLHPSSSLEKRDSLISQLLFSYEKALSILTKDGSDAHTSHISESTILESPSSFGYSSPMSEISDQDCKQKNAFKKRKTMPRWTKEVNICSGSGLEGTLDDGYSWRKYGQKDILGANHPRGYYRCTHRNTQSCVATKQVQKSDADPTVILVAYRGEHTCCQTPQLARASAASTAKEASKGNQNGRQESEKPKNSLETSFSFGAGLRVKTEDLDARIDDIFPSFSFPFKSENVGDHIFCATTTEENLMGSYSPAFVSPAAATFELDYFAVSPCHMGTFGLGHDVQSSESGLTEIISAPTSVANSPIGDFDFPIDDLAFDPFENIESFLEKY